MKSIRILASVTLLLLALYFALRAAATSCTGAGCDAYIPFSLLLPVLVLASAAVTGTVAVLNARPGGPWFAALVAVTGFGVVGPVIALVVFRDSPDRFVPVATALVLLVAVTALGYSVAGGKQKGGAR